ncbi:MAG: GNAT family N-acetyltransferase [Sulfuricurvum sp. PD_MW2]|jgi:RimJ/RimL family protein N-acetyltransferase|uniref:GNAT family N-acetyltransferase n=1 Tax=Sulfuricurvum sp. PD_MW2 TaxID=2027917 RepID=UPI000C06602B|nr:GNAT family N-acetyltransferase [Sulfuricurvum sp. PD_MW2]PHM18610.1 MAG: GNAT family N-acetyltransferase [Sulfuricurvum sp. PD_MW2]
MRLEGERVYLRPIELSDADGVYPSWLNDPEVCRYNSHGDTLYTKEMAQSYIKSVIDNPSMVVFAICLREDGRHVGNIALQQISLKNRNAELAVLIGDFSVYGRGMGYESGKLLVDYAFSTLKLHRLYCGTHSENIGMQKLALKLGMSEEGRRREALWKNGIFADIVEYGLINTVSEKETL